ALAATPRATLFPYTTLFRSTGTETSIRLEEKFRRYLQLAEMAKKTRMLFVTVSEKRRQLAELTFEHLSSQIPVPKDFDIAFLVEDRKSTRLNSSHVKISYAV